MIKPHAYTYLDEVGGMSPGSTVSATTRWVSPASPNSAFTPPRQEKREERGREGSKGGRGRESERVCKRRGKGINEGGGVKMIMYRCH